MIDQGWCIDDGPDEGEDWDVHDESWDDEPPEPDWWHEYWPPLCGRERRQVARARAQDQRRWRKVWRHRNDRFWQARNRGVFDQEAPF